ncbi:hypothetical protein NEMIN01_1924 [Nematocida minor]|uniref:uncharacterized protein n=1 Tax=Nematocida minor TaxID=1912983 RepID=UPI00221EC0B9|nr:uncharacterized protein NEMIN01_1924 [Nematocida minor]KAI5192295.1 hypothetical protein NEMIN01_1924 [Nematocida minor]
MHEGRFNYEEKSAPKSDAYISTTVLNALIYEYLIKRNYAGSAKVFKVEGDISNINITQGSSALLDWFVAFNDLYNVRSGRGKSSGIVSKIDAMLGKMAKEEGKEEYKPRHTQPPSQQASWYRKDGDILNSILEIDETEYRNRNHAGSHPAHTAPHPSHANLAAHTRPSMSNSGIGSAALSGGMGGSTPNSHGSTLVMKEVTKLRLHSQKVNSMSVCHRHKILITGGMDASICVVNLINMSDVIKFESHTMQISQVKVKDSSNSMEPYIYFGSASLDREAKVYKVIREDEKLSVSLFLSLKGHKSSVKALDFGVSKIYTIGIDGELRIWGMDGVCLGAFALRRTVKMMMARSDSMIAVGDVNSISLFNPESATYIKDISNKGAVAMYKTQSNNIFVLSDGVIVYDKSFYTQNTIPFPSDKIQCACVISGRLFLGGYQMVYEVQEKTVYTMQVYDGMVSAMEGTVIGSRSMLLTGGQNGEVKVWEVLERPEG